MYGEQHPRAGRNIITPIIEKIKLCLKQSRLTAVCWFGFQMVRTIQNSNKMAVILFYHPKSKRVQNLSYHSILNLYFPFSGNYMGRGRDRNDRGSSRRTRSPSPQRRRRSPSPPPRRRGASRSPSPPRRRRYSRSPSPARRRD